jgi:putative ABC transport system permease protein
MHDFRLALRTLRKSPGFMAVAVTTLALGVGANTAIFSVVKAVLLNPLPYRDPERLVAIAEASHDSGPRAVTVDFTTTHDWRERSKSFERMSLYHATTVAMVEQGEPEVVSGLRVNYDFFDTLGEKVQLGRGFTAEEDHSKTRFEMILSHGLWVRRFGADPGVLGRVVRLNETSFKIVGVLPEDFETLVGDGHGAEMFMPLGYDLGEQDACRGCQHLRLIARLKAGVSARAANAELDSILAQMIREHPTDYAPDSTVRVTPLRENILGGVSTALWVLTGAVALVLLIACVNVANLLLARASGRAKEIALRAALGAGRGRLIRQMLTESAVLAMAGGAAGVAISFAALDAFLKFAPAGIPRLGDVRVDGAVLLFSLAATILTGILFGIGPALGGSRVDLNDALKGSGKSTESRASVHLRGVLAAGEFALAFVLVVGAGLMAKSFARLMNVNPGYDAHHVLTLGAYVYGSRYQGKPAAEIGLYDQVMASLKTNPQVESAAMVSTLPLGGFDRRGVHIQDRRLANEDASAPFVDTYSITPDYFHVMKIPVLRGRAFTDQDRTGAPLAAIVSEGMARALWPDGDAIGRRIQLGGRHDDRPFAEIVGVVGSVRQYGLDRAPDMEAYLPLAQNTDFGYQMVIRTTADPELVASAAREAFRAADRTQAIYAVQPLESYVASTLEERTLTLGLIGLFGALALALAGVGIYGVVSYTVSLRTREVGIRIALGAGAGKVVGMVLGQALMLAGVGLTVGVVASVGVTRFLTSLLYEVRPTDLGTSVESAAVLVVVALGAAWWPARRASRVDPVVALRGE